jgi:hypothetical protein
LARSPWKLERQQTTALAQAIGSTSRRATVLREQAWQQIARRITEPHSTSSTTTTSLAANRPTCWCRCAAGFVGFDQVDGQGSIEEFLGWHR